jgi:hypothetical protein
MANGETTFILQYPTWWSYALSMAGALVFVLATLVSVLRAWRALRQNAAVTSTGAVH